MRSAALQPALCGARWNACASDGCFVRYARSSSIVMPTSASALSTSFCASCLALNSCICTRLYTLTAPSPLVSIGRKMPCGYSSVMNDCTPSDTDDDGMHPNGLTDRVMLTFEYRSEEHTSELQSPCNLV